MQETWVWSLGWEDPLEKGKATHSSLLAWRIPWTMSMGSQRVGLDWVTFTFTFNACRHCSNKGYSFGYETFLLHTLLINCCMIISHFVTNHLTHKSVNFKFIYNKQHAQGFPGGSDGKESACNAGDARDMGSFPGLGRSLGGGHGSPLQYSCLKNPMDKGAWLGTIHGIAKS